MDNKFKVGLLNPSRVESKSSQVMSSSSRAFFPVGSTTRTLKSTYYIDYVLLHPTHNATSNLTTPSASRYTNKATSNPAAPSVCHLIRKVAFTPSTSLASQLVHKAAFALDGPSTSQSSSIRALWLALLQEPMDKEDSPNTTMAAIHGATKSRWPRQTKQPPPSKPLWGYYATR
ncbi:hypothetical protein ACLOJK_006892 [Asimina triloba]